MVRALSFNNQEFLSEALDGMNYLTRITPAQELGRYLQLDVDHTVIDLLRNKDIDPVVKRNAIKIISNLTVVDDFQNLVKVYLSLR